MSTLSISELWTHLADRKILINKHTLSYKANLFKLTQKEGCSFTKTFTFDKTQNTGPFT